MTGKTRKTGKEIRNLLFFKHIKPGGAPSGFLFVHTARMAPKKQGTMLAYSKKIMFFAI